MDRYSPMGSDVRYTSPQVGRSRATTYSRGINWSSKCVRSKGLSCRSTFRRSGPVPPALPSSDSGSSPGGTTGEGGGVSGTGREGPKRVDSPPTTGPSERLRPTSRGGRGPVGRPTPGSCPVVIPLRATLVGRRRRRRRHPTSPVSPVKTIRRTRDTPSNGDPWDDVTPIIT